MSNVLAFAESRGGDVRRAALEAVAAARVIADAKGGQVHAILFGSPGIGAHAGKLAAHGADSVLVVEHAGFTHNNPEAVAATIAAKVRVGAIAPSSAPPRPRARTSRRASPPS
jgi:electron transfer flavoprotein alpha subunit